MRSVILILLVTFSIFTCRFVHGSQLAKLFNSGEKFLFPAIGYYIESISHVVQNSNVSSYCKSDIIDVINGINNHSSWALQCKYPTMIDFAIKSLIIFYSD